jgi:hypothetical protein
MDAGGFPEGDPIRIGEFMLSMARPVHSPDPKAALPPKASASRAKAEAEASSGARASAGPVSGMRPKEAALAGYLMARAALHRKIEGPVLKNLRAGHESVQEVSELLPLGRANVREDFRKTRGQRALERHLASVKLRDIMDKKFMPPDGATTVEAYSPLAAATSQYATSGVCHSYATNTTPLHAAKLAGMRDKRAIVAQANHGTVDHVWAEMISHGRGRDGKPILHGEDVIMDGWCKENVAILREDCEFARQYEAKKGHENRLSHHNLLDHKTGPEAWAMVEQFKARIEESASLQQEFHSELHRLVTSPDQFEVTDLWIPQPIFHEDFREQAGAALRQEVRYPGPGKGARVRGTDPAARRFKHGSLAEIQAVGVARSLGSNIGGAVADAPGILAAARELFPPPKSKSEKLLSRLSEFLRS